MVSDKLHLICGNCGADDHWEGISIEDGVPVLLGPITDTTEAYLTCGNCSTVHPLGKYTHIKNETIKLNPKQKNLVLQAFSCACKLMHSLHDCLFMVFNGEEYISKLGIQLQEIEKRLGINISEDE